MTAVGEQLGPYLLTDVLGTGRIGRVFLGRTGDARVVAIKVMREELAANPDLVECFLRSARTMSTVAHPRLVHVLDSGTSQAGPYLTMPYLVGRRLDRSLLQRRGLSFREVCRVVADVAGALDALHVAGVIHRSVTPSNLMLHDDRRATLMDPGVAHRDEPVHVSGTGWAYLAPELIRRGLASASEASDIYALACVAHEALTGRAPSPLGMLDAHGEHHVLERSRVHELRPDLSPEVSQAIGLAMAHEPQRRPPTATAFATLLRAGGS
jgi:serine/threonine-protein kinase